jgi:hypothetical protein
MTVTFKVIEPVRLIGSKIRKAAVYELNKRVDATRTKTRLKNEVSEMIRIAIINSPEFESLLNGKLRGELGVPNALPILGDMLITWLNSVQVKMFRFREVGTNIVGGFSISAIQADFEDVFSIPDTQFISENDHEVPWLRWLLTAGDRVMVTTHYYETNARFLHRSRTGQGVMRKKHVGRGPLGGPGWRVPPEFSGTEDRNWITRAIVGRHQGIIPQVRRLFKDIMFGR